MVAMTLSRTGDGAQSDRIRTALQSTTSRLRAAQVEVSTGKRATSFDQISSEAGLLLRTKEQRALTASYSRQNEQAVDRLNAVDGALGHLGDIAQRMRNLLVQRLDAAAGARVPLDHEAVTLLAETAAQLNLRLDERYLFAGSQIDRPPVELPSTPLGGVDGVGYYRGDGVAATVRADRGVEITYGVTGDHPAFVQLIGAMGQAAAAHRADDHAGLRTALDRLDAAVGALAELRGSVGAVTARLEAVVTSQSSSLLYLDDIVARIEDADIPQALARIAQDQAALEASYLTSSRLGQLSLADYLR